jgi:nucleoside-diphosphate-sugar epimerase
MPRAILLLITTIIAIIMSSSSALTVLVVGATGATGKHVVAQLLQKHHTVRTIVRSKDRLLSSLVDILGAKDMDNYTSQLQITEAAILDLSDEELQKQVEGCDAVVQTLGHNLTFKGMYGVPRKLVTESIQRLTKVAEATNPANGKKAKVILMGSDGVSHPDKSTDDIRPFSERVVLAIIRALVPPHRDNEAAAKYIYADVGTGKSFEWTVVRPTDLVDADTTSKYVTYAKPIGGLFGDNTVSRINVAQFMVDLLTSNDLWKTWVYKMPVLHNAEEVAVSK